MSVILKYIKVLMFLQTTVIKEFSTDFYTNAKKDFNAIKCYYS